MRLLFVFLLAVCSIRLMAQSIVIADKPQDKIKFTREYKAVLTKFISVKITCESTGYASLYPPDGRNCRAELDQPDGKWVMYDIENPADKILDREALPIIKRYSAQILELDRAYAKSHPKEFVDETGTRWVKKDSK